MLDSLISLIAPHHCYGCGGVGRVLCTLCAETQIIPSASRCYRCHKASKQFQVCPKCRASVALQHVWIASMHEGLAKDVLQALKFHRARAAATDIAICLDRLLPILPEDLIVCHIPTANKRIRQRGYDQSSLIASALARRRGYAHSSLLLRLTSSRQLGVGRSERFKQAQNAFSVKALPKGAHILLVDDVTTSGATLEAASKLLKQAGAKTVDACVFTQALD
jgi:competence protein ComFC